MHQKLAICFVFVQWIIPGQIFGELFGGPYCLVCRTNAQNGHLENLASHPTKTAVVSELRQKLESMESHPNIRCFHTFFLLLVIDREFSRSWERDIYIYILGIRSSNRLISTITCSCWIGDTICNTEPAPLTATGSNRNLIATYYLYKSSSLACAKYTVWLKPQIKSFLKGIKINWKARFGTKNEWSV